MEIRTYCDLTEQLHTFHGPSFCPTFVVGVENLSVANNEAIDKVKQTYFLVRR